MLKIVSHPPFWLPPMRWKYRSTGILPLFGRETVKGRVVSLPLLDLEDAEDVEDALPLIGLLHFLEK